MRFSPEPAVPYDASPYLKKGLRAIEGWLFPYSARFIDLLGRLQNEAGVGGASARSACTTASCSS